MSACRYLNGENIAPRTARDARALIGKSVVYLRSADIDKSGRGYLFPKQGVVSDVVGKNIDLGDQNWEYMSSIIEMVEQTK